MFLCGVRSFLSDEMRVSGDMHQHFYIYRFLLYVSLIQYPSNRIQEIYNTVMFPS